MRQIMDKAKRNNTLTCVLFIIYIVALTWIILFKLHFSFAEISRIRTINLIPFQGSDAIGANEIYNILFFMPLGIYICMLKTEWLFIKKVAAIFCLSLSFEIAQYLFAIGRTDIADLLCNTLGGLIGIGIYELIFIILKHKTNKILNVVALVFTICIVSFFVLLITHAIPLRIQL